MTGGLFFGVVAVLFLVIGGIVFLLLKVLPEGRPTLSIEEPDVNDFAQSPELRALAAQLPFPVRNVHLKVRESPASISAAFEFDPKVAQEKTRVLHQVDIASSLRSVVPIYRPKEPWWPEHLRKGDVGKMVSEHGYALYATNPPTAKDQEAGWWMLLNVRTGQGYAWY
ncbi:MAG: hypothetical protein ACOCX1_02210 [Fimbriimonadaceae bacterium]